jgi:hypothetical protein
LHKDDHIERAGPPGLWVPPEAIADFDLGGLRLRRTASPCPLLRPTDRFDLIVQVRVTPRPWLAPTPPLATAYVLGNGRLRSGGPGKPPRLHRLDVGCQTLGCLGLSGGIRHRYLVGHLAGVHDQKAYLGDVEAPVSVLHGHRAGDTLPVPASWRLLPCPAGLFEQERQCLLLLAPGLSLLPPRTGARHQCDAPHSSLEAHPPRAFTVGRPVRYNAAHPIESER